MPWDASNPWKTLREDEDLKRRADWWNFACVRHIFATFDTISAFLICCIITVYELAAKFTLPSIKCRFFVLIFHHIIRRRMFADLTPNERRFELCARFVPCIRWLRTYKWRSHLKDDVLAGITVAFLIVPQGLSYAQVAGLPPIYGLCAFVISQRKSFPQ